jgi:hypothetical protein
MQAFIKWEAFGNPTKELVDNLASRVGSTEDHPEFNAFVNVSIKLKDGFEDKFNLVNRLNNWFGLKKDEDKMKVKFECN